MSINSAMKYKLGQVGGFPLRLSWLPRLVIWGEPFSFKDPDNIALHMGIGRNMVKALRVWAMATGIIDGDNLTERAKNFSRPAMVKTNMRKKTKRYGYYIGLFAPI